MPEILLGVVVLLLLLFAVSAFVKADPKQVARVLRGWREEARRNAGADARPASAGARNLLRDLGFGDLGFDLLQPECSLRLLRSGSSASTIAPRRKPALAERRRATQLGGPS